MEGQPIASRLTVAVPDAPAERLGRLFDTHYARLYRLARRLVPGMDDALDLVQDTFLRAARSQSSIPTGGIQAEEAWLVRVLVNLRRDEWRKVRVRVRHVQNEKTDGTIRNHSGPETEWIARTDVWKALDQLSPRRRAIIVMHELDAVSLPAIASLLGISAITVRWHLTAGRRELARALKPIVGDLNEKA